MVVDERMLSREVKTGGLYAALLKNCSVMVKPFKCIVKCGEII